MDFLDWYHVLCTFYLLVYLYYTFNSPKPCMNQQVDMNRLMKYISWATVSACEWGNEVRNWTVGKVKNT